METYDPTALVPPEEPEDLSEMCDRCRHCIDVDGAPVCIADHHKRGMYAGTRITEFYEPCDEWEKA